MFKSFMIALCGAEVGFALMGFKYAPHLVGSNVFILLCGIIGFVLLTYPTKKESK